MDNVEDIMMIMQGLSEQAVNYKIALDDTLERVLKEYGRIFEMSYINFDNYYLHRLTTLYPRGMHIDSRYTVLEVKTAFIKSIKFNMHTGKIEEMLIIDGDEEFTIKDFGFYAKCDIYDYERSLINAIVCIIAELTKHKKHISSKFDMELGVWRDICTDNDENIDPIN